jgi:Zn finger protein HypA/HybF involved in hydrogenase expression
MEIKTNPDYWDCECEHNYIHSKLIAECRKCHARADEMPDSLAHEVEEVTR